MTFNFEIIFLFLKILVFIVTITYLVFKNHLDLILVSGVVYN